LRTWKVVSRLFRSFPGENKSLPKTSKNSWQEDIESVDGHRGGEKGRSKEPDIWVEEGEFDPFAVEFLSSSEYSVTLFAQPHGFLLLCIQEPSRLRGTGKEDPAGQANNNCDAELDDEQPSPRRQSLLRSHLLDSPCEESAKSTREAHGQIVGYDSFADFVAGIDGREEVCETLLKTASGRVHEHAADDSLAVVLDESSAESGSAPNDERGAESLVGSESPDGQDPGHFKEHSSKGREGVDVAELAAMEAKIFVEAKDSGIAKLRVCVSSSKLQRKQFNSRCCDPKRKVA
jgi:hypothetical protein